MAEFDKIVGGVIVSRVVFGQTKAFESESVETMENNDLIVHALVAGRLLCGFSDKDPVDWPPEHSWTDVSDSEHISCPDCVAKAAAIIAARPESEEPQRPSIADLE